MSFIQRTQTKRRSSESPRFSLSCSLGVEVAPRWCFHCPTLILSYSLSRWSWRTLTLWNVLLQMNYSIHTHTQNNTIIWHSGVTVIIKQQTLWATWPSCAAKQCVWQTCVGKKTISIWVFWQFVNSTFFLKTRVITNSHYVIYCFGCYSKFQTDSQMWRLSLCFWSYESSLWVLVCWSNEAFWTHHLGLSHFLLFLYLYTKQLRK